jgi:hypothetical protein
MKITTTFSSNTRRAARPGRLPRPVIWLALLAALGVAILGALVSQSRLQQALDTARHAPGRALAPSV